MKTFDILKEFDAFYEIASEIEFDEETGEVIDRTDTLEELLESITGDAGEKLENIEYIKRDILAKCEAIKAEEKRLATRRNGMEANIERMKSLQLMLVNLAGGKLKTDKFTFSKRKSESVELDTFVDASMLPEEYRKISYSADKTKLKKAIKQGVHIEGVEIVENEGVSVR